MTLLCNFVDGSTFSNSDANAKTTISNGIRRVTFPDFMVLRGNLNLGSVFRFHWRSCLTPLLCKDDKSSGSPAGADQSSLWEGE